MIKKRSIADAIEALITGTSKKVVPVITEKTRVGRPKDEARNIALLAHLFMSRPEISNEASVKRRRFLAGNAIGVGRGVSDIETVEKSVAKSVKKAQVSMGTGGWDVITISGDELGQGRCWIAIQHDGIGVVDFISESKNPGSIEILGYGWMCEWGERRAKYGLIRTDRTNPLITISQGAKTG